MVIRCFIYTCGQISHQRSAHGEVPGVRQVPAKRGHAAFKRRAFAEVQGRLCARSGHAACCASVNLHATLMFFSGISNRAPFVMASDLSARLRAM